MIDSPINLFLLIIDRGGRHLIRGGLNCERWTRLTSDPLHRFSGPAATSSPPRTTLPPPSPKPAFQVPDGAACGRSAQRPDRKWPLIYFSSLRLEGRDGRGVRVVHRADAVLQRRSAAQHDPGRRRRPHQPGAPEVPQAAARWVPAPLCPSCPLQAVQVHSCKAGCPRCGAGAICGTCFQTQRACKLSVPLKIFSLIIRFYSLLLSSNFHSFAAH